MKVLLVFLALASPPLQAVWERPGIARVSWSGAGCLWKGDTFIQCYQGGGVLRLGDKGPLDGRMRVYPHDIFTLQRPDGSIEQATIKSLLYFPVMR